MSFKLLTGDNINGVGRILSKRFKELGFEVSYCSNSYPKLDAALSEFLPDGLVFFVTNEREELFSFIERTVRLYPQMKIFAISYMSSVRLRERLLEMGVYRYFLMPVTTNYICMAVMESVLPEEQLLYLPEIVEFLIHKGIYHYITGFFYMCTAIEISITRPELLSAMTEKFYPMIAEKHNVSSAFVECSLRRLGESAAGKGVTFSGYVGTYPMSNHDMISAAADEFVGKYNIFKK